MTIKKFKDFYFEVVKIQYDGKDYWPEEFLKEIRLTPSRLGSFEWGTNSPSYDNKQFESFEVADLGAICSVTSFVHEGYLFFFFVDEGNQILFSVRPYEHLKNFKLEEILKMKNIIDISEGNRNITELIKSFSKIASLILKVVIDKGEAKFSPAHSRPRKIYNNFVQQISNTEEFRANNLKAHREGLSGWKISKE